MDRKPVSLFPAFHYRPARGWINDPVGFIQDEDGRYHLFVQHVPDGVDWKPFIQWSHAISTDLVRWQFVEPALVPDGTGSDGLGVWSGSVVIDDGVPTAIYSALGDERDRYAQQVNVARGSEDWLTWSREPANPVIAGPPPELGTIGFRDPWVWRDGSVWRMIIGASVGAEAAAILGYTSSNLLDWDYAGVVFQRSTSEVADLWTGRVWECPQFPAVGDERLLLASVWDYDDFLYIAAMRGTLTGMRFEPESVARFDHGPDFYSGAATTDHQSRLIVVGWAREDGSDAARLEGWTGMISVPRQVELDDAGLIIQPVAELEGLRGDLLARSGSHTLRAGSPHLVAEDLAVGELVVRAPSDVGVMIDVFADRDRTHSLTIEYAPDRREVVVDRSNVSPDANPTQTRFVSPLDTNVDEVVIRTFLDRTIAEVFVNDRVVFTVRVYPCSGSTSTFVTTESDGQLTIDAWPLVGTPDA